ncbi:MAG TPA: NAD(P)-dependent oxidoreductase [Pseudomonadales bacterium]|nr:NAD(P)-dependent oxidoreductase [Pseudomonadales bacterium]
MQVAPVSLHGKKILVTGPTSQVALPLLQQLCPIADVYALARFSRQKDVDRIRALGAHVLRKDLAADSLGDIPDDFDYVLHFAVVKSGNFDYDLRANAIGSGRLLAHCKRAKAFLQVSTTGVYQYAGQTLLKEDAPLGDNHRAMFPTYSISKIAQETVVRFAAMEHAVPLTIARLSVPYGDNGGWPYWHAAMMKEGMPVVVHPDQPNAYNPIHAEDYCRHIPYLLAAATTDATIVNWGGSEVVSVESWCEWISELTGFRTAFDLQPTAFGSLASDVSKLQALLGDEPVTTVTWKEGILRMLRNTAPQWLTAQYQLHGDNT